VDERACVLARALDGEVGGSSDPAWSESFVVRLGDPARARAVAGAVGQPCNEHGEVLLPEPLVRLAVAFDRGVIRQRSARYVAPGQLSLFDDLDAACQEAADDDDSSRVHRLRGSKDVQPPRAGRVRARGDGNRRGPSRRRRHLLLVNARRPDVERLAA
jgi:hypothetical protein